MPKLWVFRRVPELKNRTGFIYVADDKLAAKLLREDAATEKVDFSRRPEKPPRPGATPLPAPVPEPLEDASADTVPRPKRKRKAAEE